MREVLSTNRNTSLWKEQLGKTIQPIPAKRKFRAKISRYIQKFSKKKKNLQTAQLKTAFLPSIFLVMNFATAKKGKILRAIFPEETIHQALHTPSFSMQTAAGLLTEKQHLPQNLKKTLCLLHPSLPRKTVLLSRVGLPIKTARLSGISIPIW